MIAQVRIKYKKAYTNQEDYDYTDDSEELKRELEEIKKSIRVPKNTWIIKPGENTNRGNGIDVCKSL